MRILMVTKFYHPRIGGVETTVKELCEEFVRRGHRCTVVTMDHELRGRVMINGVEVIRCPVDSKLLGGLNRHVWRHLSQEVRPGMFDIVHLHSYHILLSAQSAYLCHRHKVPFIFSAHYHGKGHTPLRDLLFRSYRFAGKNVLRWSEKITCVSEYEKGLLLRDFPGLEGKVGVIPSGIKGFPILTVERRKDTLLYVGRVTRYKGIDHVLQAVKVLKERGKEVRLRVVGSGPEEGALHELAQQLGVDEAVTWLGDVGDDELNREYRSSAALVLLSAAEAYGLVVAEALSCGTPAIVAKKEALVEFLNEPGCVGVDWPPDPEKVADTVQRVLEGREATKVGSFSNKIAPWRVIAQEYLRLYDSAIAVRGPDR
jgi:glycosyltransferase involved in cell wall biosynthesis